MRQQLITAIETIYSKLPAVPPHLQAKYKRRYEMDKKELMDLLRELYRLTGVKLAKPDKARHRYHPIEDLEIVDDEVEPVPDDFEVVEDRLELVEDDEYLGQRIVKKRWKNI